VIESVDDAVARVKAAGATRSARARVVNQFLKGTANPRSAEGRALMQKRAEFVTKLRTQGIWP
jgi:hypothetical protein